jgi:hypothetical protein
MIFVYVFKTTVFFPIIFSKVVTFHKHLNFIDKKIELLGKMNNYILNYLHLKN